MSQKTIHPKSLEDLKKHIQGRIPSLYLGSRTSTVIPFDRLRDILKEDVIVDLGQMPTSMEIENDHLVLSGPVTWKDAREFCQSHGYNILTSPTEELASMLSGIATSCTGERCFGRGTLRSQLLWVEYMDHEGEIRRLDRSEPLPFLEGSEELVRYQKSYEQYEQFKNAPFPRMSSAVDLMVGTEGQLGVITRAAFQIEKTFDAMFLFFKVPKWEQDYEPHLEIFEAVQKYRGKIISCELLDENSLSVLAPEEKPECEGDLIFMEIAASDFENIYSDMIKKITRVKDEDIFEMSFKDCHALRMAVPRRTFEVNSQMGVVKVGTDIQVSGERFSGLMDAYRELASRGIRYNLFGHFGDAHLHFNFLPAENDYQRCLGWFEGLYKKVHDWQGSPFAEHGVGLLKQKYMADFYQDIHKNLFRALKKEMDPDGQFFPSGFMTEAAK